MPRARRAACFALLFCALVWLPAPMEPVRGAPSPAAAPANAAAARPAPADVVLRGGAVYTVDAVRRWAEAVAVRGPTIVYVGAAQGAEAYVGPKTRVVELKGKMLLPAFQDAHIHPISSGVSYASGCKLYDLSTREEYVAAVQDCATQHPGSGWIRGDGWSLPAFANGLPDKRLLDAAAPERPVYLESKDGHSAWVNSKALQIAGITRDTSDPQGGRIDRDASGEPLGSLQDGAMSLVAGKIPPYTLEERQAGLRYALRMLARYGVTSFQDASVNRQDLEVYRALDERHELTARVVGSIWWERAEGLEQIPRILELRRTFTKGNVRATTVKIMQDGVLETQTAALLKPYVGKGDQKGLSMVEPELLKKAVTALDKEGFQVHFHAIGDAAIRQCLDAIEAAQSKNGVRDSRHHIAHIQLFHPDDIPRFRALGVVANFQPLWAFADDYIKDLTLPFLDAERQRWIYPIGSLLKSGAVVAFGSDWSVSSANPLEELEVAVTRMGPNGETKEPYLPEERIDLRDALAAFTLNAAYVNFQEDRTGSIEVGKLADLIVLDRNLFAIPPEQISDARVLLTLFGGRPIWGDFSLSGGGTSSAADGS
ncbi:MAG TPA: amidohydrolase family protein [Candidatus Polarisedimenticolia bacterium]|jgi:hypothetical protein|nr:amidohydrolase family protein [Candidatus Polarisedimenticolia bacterium]